MARSKKKFHRRVSSKNQVALPVVFMKKLSILPRSTVVFSEQDGGILIRPVDDPIEKAQGFLSDIAESATEIKQELRDQEQQEARKFDLS